MQVFWIEKNCFEIKYLQCGSGGKVWYEEVKLKLYTLYKRRGWCVWGIEEIVEIQDIQLWREC